MQTDLRALVALAASAPSGKIFREVALDAIAVDVSFDAAFFHALSPRVSLATAATRGIDEETIAESMKHWDRFAVDFGRFRDFALEHGGVATDRDALPASGPKRIAFQRAFGEGQRARAAALVHLVVRDRIVSVIVLLRWRAVRFSPPEVDYLRAIAPVLAAGDALHQSLDRAQHASVATKLRCHDQRLTPRQRDVVEHVALGYTNVQIAKAIGRSANTVRNLLADTMQRLGAANRADLVRLAVLR